MKTSLTRSAAAGVLICMGCIVNLKAGGGIPGAVLFSAGLWFVVNFDAELFTGRVTRETYDPLQKLIMLVMNVAGAGICGLLASFFLPEIAESARGIAAAYQDPVKVIWQSVMCGICMYLATTPPKAKDISRLPFVVYGVALFSMFVTSTMYHAIRDQEVKSFVRKFDHAMIYFAIGGTYVPIVNAILPTVQGMIWYGGLGLCAVVGAVSSFLTLKHKYVTTAVYLVMGWASLLLLPKMLHLPEEFHVSGSRMAGMLIGGGVVYSVGAALYLIKLRFVHSVFHVFVVGGAVLQYLAIRMLYC